MTKTTIKPVNPAFYFWLFILTHTLFWTVGSALLRPTMPHDVLEGISWGLQWQLGYNKHPFLTAWLNAGITQLFGVVGWPVYLLSQLAILVTFWATWKLAKAILPPMHALIATLALEGVLFYNINSFNLTPDTLQSPLWALTALVFYKALTTQKIPYWLGTGLLAALCVCTKYQVALLLLPMFLLCIFNLQARESFKQRGIYYGITLFLLLISPHILWLIQHDFISISYALNTSEDYTQKAMPLRHITFPLQFLFNNITHVIALFILFWPFYKTDKIQLDISPFQWQFLLYISFGPILLTLMLCTLSGNYFPLRWSTPYYFTLGILVMACVSPKLSKKNMQQFALSLILVSITLFGMRMLTLTIMPRANSDAFLPNQQIATALSRIWQERYNTPLPFIAGSNYLVTGITPYLPGKPRPIPYLNWSKTNSPWVDENELRQKGGLFIWDEGFNYNWDKDSSSMDAQLNPSVRGRFPTLKLLPTLTFYRLSNNQPVSVGVAILPPG